MQLERAALNINLAFLSVLVFYKIKFHAIDGLRYEQCKMIVDVVHCHSKHHNKCHQIIPGRFDIVLVDVGERETVEVAGIHSLLSNILI